MMGSMVRNNRLETSAGARLLIAAAARQAEV
jgi:hypothetical protein